ncbi:MAG: N-acetyl-D-Glu racemase DgcA [Pseudomonadota bacterium]
MSEPIVDRPPLPPLTLQTRVEHWPIAGAFSISRGTKRKASVIVAELSDGTHIGKGECVPYARFDENLEDVEKAIQSLSPDFTAQSVDQHALQDMLSAGAARNAIDCALWDYDAKRLNTPVFDWVDVPSMQPKLTAYTISLSTPDGMAKQIQQVKDNHPLLKVKLGGQTDEECMRAVRYTAPHARLIADANEGWSPETLPHLLAVAYELGFELIEQPLPTNQDLILEHIDHSVLICADEAIHTSQDLEALKGRYDAVNIKLDKAGGLTEGLAMVRLAKTLNLKIVVGCMVGTSLAMAPATLLAQFADWVDLDGPLLLEQDRAPGLHYDQSVVYPSHPKLWG